MSNMKSCSFWWEIILVYSNLKIDYHGKIGKLKISTVTNSRATEIYWPHINGLKSHIAGLGGERKPHNLETLIIRDREYYTCISDDSGSTILHTVQEIASVPTTTGYEGSIQF